MGTFNTFILHQPCAHCQVEIDQHIQFKYADTWQHTYHLGDTLEWGGNQTGNPAQGLVVLDAATEDCPHCGHDEEFYVVFVEDNRLVGAAPNQGRFHFEGDLTYALLPSPEPWVDDLLWGYHMQSLGLSASSTERDLVDLVRSREQPSARKLQALDILGHRPTLAAETVLSLQELLAGPEDISHGVVTVFSRLTSDQANFWLLPLLQGQSLVLRRAALAALSRVNHPGGSQKENTRRIHTDFAVPATAVDVQDLFQRHLHDADPEMVTLVIPLLGSLGVPLYPDDLLRYSPHARVRAAFIQQVREQVEADLYPDSDLKTIWADVMQMLQDPEPAVRQQAALGLIPFVRSGAPVPRLDEENRLKTVEHLQMHFGAEGAREVRAAILTVARFSFDLPMAREVFLLGARHPSLQTRMDVLQEVEEAFQTGGAMPSYAFRKDPMIHQVLHELSEEGKGEMEGLQAQAQGLFRRRF
ncbi:HEAT repeat domain-containing protein [Deinococcus roseus]|uniref:HEAT repeat domain-containing protein n=1 Tax=Deinococcus roseus TaxID=392414 RepID=A0ABQ2DHB6_9DEIO|nr:hypothetical protein [Deinococcus roseus]GGJ57748.1 hypothetical protein GCM10008938_49800 [Deinococcus roseus]